MRLHRWVVAGVACMLIVAVAVAQAQEQPRGRGRGGFGGGQFGGGPFGGGGGVLGLLRIEKVQQELELLDDQKEQLQAVGEQLRAELQQGERPNFQGFQDLSEEERQKLIAEMRERGEKMEKMAREKLADILLPNQMKRLDELSIQQRGIAALQDAEVAAKLKISDEQKEKMTAIREEMEGTLRESMREIFQSGNREEAMQKIQAMRRDMEEKVVAVLTDTQKKGFEELKGKPFEFPPAGPGFGGGRPGGGRPGGGDRPERPGRPGGDGDRPARPDR